MEPLGRHQHYLYLENNDPPNLVRLLEHDCRRRLETSSLEDSSGKIYHQGTSQLIVQNHCSNDGCDNPLAVEAQLAWFRTDFA